MPEIEEVLTEFYPLDPEVRAKSFESHGPAVARQQAIAVIEHAELTEGELVR